MQRWFAWPYRAFLAFILWTGVRPWQLTLLSLVLTIGAATLIVTGSWFAAAWVLLAAGLCDVFDGSVARHRGEEKRSGAFLDSVLDRVSDMVLFASLFWLFSHRGEAGLARALPRDPRRQPLGESRPGGGRGGRCEHDRGVLPAARAIPGAARRSCDPRRHARRARPARDPRGSDRLAARVVRARLGVTPVEWIRVGSVGEVPDGEIRAFDHPAGRVAIAHVDHRLLGVSDECTNAGCSLAEGELDGARRGHPVHERRQRLRSRDR